MKPERAADQKTEAFSAPLSLLNAAKAEAARRQMSFSGFCRYCLAREIGWSVEDAKKISLHMPIARMTMPALDLKVSSILESSSAELAEQLNEGGGGARVAHAAPPGGAPAPAPAHSPVSYRKRSKRKPRTGHTH
jgi:hypothetical protein